MAKRFPRLLMLVLLPTLAVAQNDDCSSYAPPQEQQKCVYSKYVAIGHAVVETGKGAANFLVSFRSNFFDGVERITTPHGFEFRKAGQTVTEYPDTLTVIIEPADFRLDVPVRPPQPWVQIPSPAPAVQIVPELQPLQVTVRWLDGSHRVIQSKSGELREVTEAFSELRPPRVWYLADIAGIKQPLATEVELVVTGKGNTPLAKVRGGFVYSSPPAYSRKPASK